MALPTIDHAHSGLGAQQRAQYERAMQGELARMRRAAQSGYDDERASINLPVDTDQLRPVRALARTHVRAKLIVVIGIGGSNLGTIAVQESLLGAGHDLSPGTRPRILYADTVDPSRTLRILDLVDKALRSREHVVVSLVSKSGTTAESAANAQAIVRVLEARRKRAQDHLVVTTDEGSPLWNIAKESGIPALAIPKSVGGRYSLFSPVGLFPLSLLNINVRKLLAGAAAMRERCLQEKDNPAMLRAAMLAHAKSQGRTIADNFYFAANLESVGKWYRQLMGESIGKEWDRAHSRRLWMGMTPTVSIGTTDLHSMAQLYFGGPQDKFHTLVAVERWEKDVRVPAKNLLGQLAPDIQGKSFAQIMGAVVQGVARVLEQQGRSHCRIKLLRIDEETVGALLQLHMMEMMFLGALLGVNPFDQPNVEAYKIETKRVLAEGKR
jgi:glucose-6-phosphate isomerase